MGDTGYYMGYFYDRAITYDLSVAGYSWHWSSELFDGDPVFFDIIHHKFYADPSVLFKDGKIYGVSGQLWPTSSDTPNIDMGSLSPYGVMDPYTYDPETEESYEIPSYYYEPLTDLHMSPEFSIYRTFAYGNIYSGPNFKGIWNFAGSYATVPEPQSWALLIIGFGMVAGRMRRARVPVGATRTV